MLQFRDITFSGYYDLRIIRIKTVKPEATDDLAKSSGRVISGPERVNRFERVVGSCRGVLPGWDGVAFRIAVLSPCRRR